MLFESFKATPFAKAWSEEVRNRIHYQLIYGSEAEKEFATAYIKSALVEYLEGFDLLKRKSSKVAREEEKQADKKFKETIAVLAQKHRKEFKEAKIPFKKLDYSTQLKTILFFNRRQEIKELPRFCSDFKTLKYKTKEDKRKLIDSLKAS